MHKEGINRDYRTNQEETFDITADLGLYWNEARWRLP